MPEHKVPLRSDIPDRFKWNAPSVFESESAWQAEFDAVAARLPEVEQFRGHLGDGPTVLADALALIDELVERMGKIQVYAIMDQAVDMTDQAATRRSGQTQGLAAKGQAAMAFVEPELLDIGRETLAQWIENEPRLADLTHYVDDLFRKQAHIRSAEVEQVLGMLSDPFRSASSTADMLTNADFEFEPAQASDGSKLPFTQGTLDKLLASADREARRTAWENYRDLYLAYKNTLAAGLVTSLKQNVFDMRVRGHSSTLAAALFEQNVPVEVFHNLVDTCPRGTVTGPSAAGPLAWTNCFPMTCGRR
jgi:oligoendopeptidase F